MSLWNTIFPYTKTLDSVQVIIHTICKSGLYCVDPNNWACICLLVHPKLTPNLSFVIQANADCIFDYRIDSSPLFKTSPEIAQVIHELWKDLITWISKQMDHSNKFYLMNSII